jgi:hypothetical protein
MTTTPILPFVDSRDVETASVADEIMKQFALKPTLAHNGRNFHDARAELCKLLNVASAILRRRPDLPPGKRAEQISEIYKNSIGLRVALNEGSYSLVQTAAEADGQEWCDEAACVDDLCHRVQKALESFVPEVERQLRKLDTRAGAGRRPDVVRQRAIIECAKYFKRWSPHRVSYADESPFLRFVTEIFTAAGVGQSTALNRQIRNAINEMSKSL